MLVCLISNRAYKSKSTLLASITVFWLTFTKAIKLPQIHTNSRNVWCGERLQPLFRLGTVFLPVLKQPGSYRAFCTDTERHHCEFTAPCYTFALTALSELIQPEVWQHQYPALHLFSIMSSGGQSCSLLHPSCCQCTAGYLQHPKGYIQQSFVTSVAYVSKMEMFIPFVCLFFSLQYGLFKNRNLSWIIFFFPPSYS